MRRIFPRRICDSRGERCGFTLIEILVSLLILSILAAAAARGLMISMASDEVSMQIFQGNLLLNKIEASALRGDSPEAMKKQAGNGWRFSETLTKASETNAIVWRIISLQSTVRPSLQVQTSLRASH